MTVAREDLDAMYRREPLPTEAQINAITDVPALRALQNDIEIRATKIETDLEFSTLGDDWERRARSALAMHRLANKRIARRAKALGADRRGSGPRAHGGRQRPDDEIRMLTLEVLRTRPSIDPAKLHTIEQVDASVAWLAERINAVTSDREDEIAVVAGDRDEAFMAATGNLLREMKALRQAVQNRRGEITKAERMAAQAAREATRPQLFVDAARQVLDRDTFIRIWAIVDQLDVPGARQFVEPAHG